MNQFDARIESIKVDGHFCLVSLNCSGIDFKSIVIYDSKMQDLLKEGETIRLMFKAMEVVISNTDTSGKDSLRNRIEGSIEKIENGALMSKIHIASAMGKIEAIITGNAVEELNLEPGKKVWALIKTNEIFLSR